MSCRQTSPRPPGFETHAPPPLVGARTPLASGVCSQHMHSCMLDCMQSTSVRIDQATHRELKLLASEFGTTVGETVALAVRRLRQDRIGEELAAGLTSDEVEWLDADVG